MEMPKFTKKPNGSWTTVINLGVDEHGKRILKHLTAKTYNGLEQLVKQYRNETPKSLREAEATVGEAIDRYIRRRENEISPSTIANYKKYRHNSFPELMGIPLSKLTEEKVQAVIDKYAEVHQPKTVINRWNLVYASIKEAKKNIDWKIRLPRQKRKRLTMPDEERLLECFRVIEGRGIEIPVLLAATCGLRRGEISALDLDKDIDYDRGIIRVNKDMVMNDQGVYIIKPPKTDAAIRAIPCPAWVLEKLKAARDNPAYKIYAPNTITTKWHKIEEELGIGCSFHGLRHYYASVMSALGVPEQYAMERMGHTTDYMLKRYQEYLKTKEAEINDDMMDFYDKLNPKKEEQDG